MMHGAGQDAALVVQGRVTNVNMVNWTVDCVSQFDMHFYGDIQVSALYLHYNNGEGVCVMPEVGAVVMITIPSDTTPPYVSGFIAPMVVNGGAQLDTQTPAQAVQTSIFGTQSADPNAADDADAPQGTRSRGAGAVPFPQVDARFDAGRPPANPGDIMLRTRDGNFVTLHRGGVVSIGATELSQRIYIPIGNKILDISGDYEHQNVGGSIKWGIQEGPSITNPAAQHMETFRVFANDQFADIRVAKGKVLNPVGEPDGDAGENDDLQNLGIGTKDIICYEVTVAQGGFKAVTGDLSDPAIRNSQVLRFFFDLGGNVFLRASGSALFRFNTSLKVSVAKDIDIECDTLSINAKNGTHIGGGPLVEIAGDFIKLGGGGLPVARMGDGVSVPLAGVTVSGTLNGAPFTGVLQSVGTLNGTIISGNPNCQA